MLATLLLALAPASEPEPTQAVKVVGTADWNQLDRAARLEAKPLVIRSPAELVAAMPTQATRGAAPDFVEKENAERAAELLGVKRIDWDKQMLLVIPAGKQPTTGWKIEVVSVKARGDRLTVKWKLDGSRAKAEAISYPALVALVPAHKGEVTFEQAK